MREPLLRYAVFAAACLALFTGQAASQPDASKQCGPTAAGNHDVTHLPAVAKLPEGVSWMTDWGAQPRTGGWYEMQALDPCRYRLDPNFQTWHGLPAARVEVQPGDDPLGLNANTERAEGLIAQTGNGRPTLEDSRNGAQFYATSYFFPENWEAGHFSWSAFAPKDCQENDSNACNSWSFILQFLYKGAGPWGGLEAAKFDPKGPQRYVMHLGKKALTFSDGGLVALGKWTDFVYQMRWDVRKISVWRRDQGQDKFVKVIDDETFPPPAEPVYLKQGLYRGGAVNGRTDVYWLGPTVRASNYEAAIGAAFGGQK